MRRRSVLTLLLGLPLVVALAVVAIAFGNAEPGHTPLHVGCRHHNHGPKWHADHGRILGMSRRPGEGAEPDPNALQSRSLTSGRGAGRE